MNPNEFEEKSRQQFARLRKAAHDAGARSALRHWLSDAARPRAYPQLAAIFGTIENENWNIVAALYAFHDLHSDQVGGIGAVCRRLRGERAEHNTFEGRFKRLLLCDREELRGQLRSVILAARAKDLPVNYLRLYRDLHSWDHPYYGEKTRREWAEEFWGETAASTPGGEPVATAAQSPPTT